MERSSLTIEILENCRKEARTLLTEVEAKQLFLEAGIDVVDTVLARSSTEAAEIATGKGFPVALKIASPDISHKTDAGGVRLGVKSPAEAMDAYDSIVVAAKETCPQAVIHGVSVQKMARPGTELMIGMFNDRQFGSVLVFGLGGIFVEILKDITMGIVPLTPRDAREMVRGIKGYPLLEGYRGGEKADVERLESWLVKISQFVMAHPEIQEFDLNPIFAYEDGAIVVDARVVLRPE